MKKLFRAGALALLAWAGLLAVLVASAPYLVEHKTVRDALLKDLKAWSGGEVTIEGSIRLASLFALSVEVKGVSIAPRGRLRPVKRIEAQALTAIVSFSGLVRGRVEVDKVIMSSAKVTLFEPPPRVDPGSLVLPLTPLALAETIAEQTSFKSVTIRSAKLVYPERARRAYRTVFVSQLKLDKHRSSGTAVFNGIIHRGEDRVRASLRMGPRLADGQRTLALWVRGKANEVNFTGQVNMSAGSAAGDITLTSAGAKAASGEAADFILNPPRDLYLTGAFSLSADRLALENAKVSLGEASASGLLSLTLGGERRRLDGTLAFGALDLSSFVEGGKPLGAVATDLNAALARRLPDVDFDLRISAETVAFGQFTAGPVAVAVNSGKEGVALDIAEVGLFGGTVRGRISGADHAMAIRASGSAIDLAAYLAASNLRLPLSGRADFRIVSKLEATHAERESPTTPMTGLLEATITGSEILSGELVGELNRAAAQAQVEDGAPAKISNVSTLEVKAELKDKAVALCLTGKDANTVIDAAIDVDRASESLSGRLLIKEGEEPEVPEAAPNASPRTRLVLNVGGKLSAPIFTLAPAKSLSN